MRARVEKVDFLGWTESIYFINVSSCVDSRLSVVVKEFDEICNIGCNELFKFIIFLQCLHVLEEKSCGGYNSSREHNFLLKSENSDMKVFKLFSILELQGG